MNVLLYEGASFFFKFFANSFSFFDNILNGSSFSGYLPVFGISVSVAHGKNEL